MEEGEVITSAKPSLPIRISRLKEDKMKPIGALMREHRLIERMIGLLDAELKQMTEKNEANIDLLTTATDFLRTYADRTHHGKEEDILFRDLAKKQLSEDHMRVMYELTAEHTFARSLVTSLVNAGKAYATGNPDSLKDIMAGINEVVRFYPMHIQKEDKNFFYLAQEYLSKKEQDDMLDEFWEFDRGLIHEKYEQIVKNLESRKS
jgi:hemerythrin-like domain-containing protein